MNRKVAETALTRIREVRKEPRDHVVDSAELTWDDGAESQQSPVDVVNMSDRGSQVVSTVEISVGTTAHLTGEEFRCLGTAWYCKIDPRGFIGGLKFRREPYSRNAMAR